MPPEGTMIAGEIDTAQEFHTRFELKQATPAGVCGDRNGEVARTESPCRHQLRDVK
jgi:hypothetical protein